MTADDLRKHGEVLLRAGWRKRLSEASGMSYSAVKRAARGDTPVPAPLAVIVRLLYLVDDQGFDEIVPPKHRRPYTPRARR